MKQTSSLIRRLAGSNDGRKRKFTNRRFGRRVAKGGFSGEIPGHHNLVTRPWDGFLGPRGLCYRFSLCTFGFGSRSRLIRMSLHDRRARASVFLGSDGQVSEDAVG
jgi:hypothetical protein